MSIPTLPGITSQIVKTDRLSIHTLSSGDSGGTPVIFVHGNCASATFWEETMLTLPANYYAIALDLRGYGNTEPLPIDATQGLEDMAADVRSLIETLNVGAHHLIGHSVGGGIVMKYALAHAADLLSITLVDTMSPYGYSGSKGSDGTPVHADGAPAGAAGVNPDFIKSLAARDRGLEDPMSPRNVMRQFYFKPPFIPEREEDLLSSVLTTRIGDDHYPGNSTPSDHWPGAAPGTTGIVNAFSRKYFDASSIVNIDPKPPILWVRGADDNIVSNQGLWEIATLGSLGFVPDWPGNEECPAQPTLDQIKAVLKTYKANGGTYQEATIEDAGHNPFIEKPKEFNKLLHDFLGSVDI